MTRAETLAAGVAVGALIAFATPPANATPISPAAKNLVAGTAVQTVQMGYCARWFRECRLRWGGGWRFRRCLVRHGC